MRPHYQRMFAIKYSCACGCVGIHIVSLLIVLSPTHACELSRSHSLFRAVALLRSLAASLPRSLALEKGGATYGGGIYTVSAK